LKKIQILFGLTSIFVWYQIFTQLLRIKLTFKFSDRAKTFPQAGKGHGNGFSPIKGWNELSIFILCSILN